MNLDEQETARYLLPTDAPEMSIYGVDERSKSPVREIMEALVFSLVVFLLVQSVVQNREVLGQSMEPSLHNDERLFLDRLSYFRYDSNWLPRLLGHTDLPVSEQYLLGGPHRGDIVVFRPPVEGEKEDYIKRVIGVAGETVQVKAYDGVYINGTRLDEPYIKEVPDYHWPAAGESGVVPAGHVFVLGDNRRNSSDSHLWGFLDQARIVGRALISYWPREDWGLLPHPSYTPSEPTPSEP
ncbi:MAG TPA: signal peptidase I [Chloroflexia bacterium]|nr:signal peptidase I [Chloroflexia bacterium]